MTALGYMPTVKLGDYDEIKRAVQKFQKDYKLLEVGGQVGPQTKFAINTVLTAGKKGIDVKYNSKKANDPDVFSVTTSFLLGAGDALVETVKGIGSLFLHPVKTAEGIAFLNNALKPGTEENVLLSYMVGTAVKQAWDDFKEGDADKKARMIGRLVGEVVLAVVGTKGVDKATKALRVSAESGKLGEMLGKVGKGTSKAEEVVGSLGKIDKALDVTTTSLDKLKAAFKGSSNPGAIVDEVVSKLGTTIKNNPLRVAYEKEVVGLKDMATSLRKKGYNDEYIARALNQARRDIGVKYKDATPPILREYIYDRNVSEYGDKLGPSYEKLVEKYYRRFNGDMDAINKKIIAVASKPNQDIDSLLVNFRGWLNEKLK